MHTATQVIWRQYRLNKARLVVSCLDDADQGALQDFLRSHNVRFHIYAISAWLIIACTYTHA